MSTKLFVGGLPWRTTEEALSETFSQAGTVISVSIITDRTTGRSKGFGFVEMSTEEEAEKAIELFNGQDFEGRNIVVSVARPKEDAPRRSFGGGDRGSDRGGYRDNR